MDADASRAELTPDKYETQGDGYDRNQREQKPPSGFARRWRNLLDGCDYSGGFVLVYCGNEAVAALGQSFDKARCVRIVSQGCANLSNREVQALIKIYESVIAPDLLRQFGARYHLAGPPNQHRQYFRWLGRQV